MMARRIAGRGRCNTSRSITSVPRASDSARAVNVCAAWDEWPSVGFADGLSNARRLLQALPTNPVVQAARRSNSSAGVSMKSFVLLSTLAIIAACAQSPTAPSTQSDARSNLSVVLAAGAVSAARNPSGTGQPTASCQSEPTQPNGFGTGGFANAEAKYAGSDGTPSLANGNSHAVSQYDVACYQLSNK
jgi:hypothetical protein